MDTQEPAINIDPIPSVVLDDRATEYINSAPVANVQIPDTLVLPERTRIIDDGRMDKAEKLLKMLFLSNKSVDTRQKAVLTAFNSINSYRAATPLAANATSQEEVKKEVRKEVKTRGKPKISTNTHVKSTSFPKTRSNRRIKPPARYGDYNNKKPMVAGRRKKRRTYTLAYLKRIKSANAKKIADMKKTIRPERTLTNQSVVCMKIDELIGVLKKYKLNTVN